VGLHARGTFEVKLTPQPKNGVEGMGRLVIDKQFSGDIQGVSQGEMLAARTAVKDSAGYVAIERVTGAIGAKRGSFVLQHSATMNRGAPNLSIIVVPDSGTDDLVGLAGRMTLEITATEHAYDLEYTIGDA
jgi:hypothetical protein